MTPTSISISPIGNGFIVSAGYGSEGAYAFQDWNSVLEYLKDKAPQFAVEEEITITEPI